MFDELPQSALIFRQDMQEDFGGRPSRAQTLDKLHPTLAKHRDIQDYHIRLEFGREPKGGAAVAGPADNNHVRGRGDQRLNLRNNGWSMVIGDENANAGMNGRLGLVLGQLKVQNDSLIRIRLLYAAMPVGQYALLKSYPPPGPKWRPIFQVSVLILLELLLASPSLPRLGGWIPSFHRRTATRNGPAACLAANQPI